MKLLGRFPWKSWWNFQCFFSKGTPGETPAGIRGKTSRIIFGGTPEPWWTGPSGTPRDIGKTLRKISGGTHTGIIDAGILILLQELLVDVEL